MKQISPENLARRLNKADCILYLIFQDQGKGRIKVDTATIIKPTISDDSTKTFIKVHEHISGYIKQLEKISFISNQ